MRLAAAERWKEKLPPIKPSWNWISKSHTQKRCVGCFIYEHCWLIFFVRRLFFLHLSKVCSCFFFFFGCAGVQLSFFSFSHAWMSFGVYVLLIEMVWQNRLFIIWRLFLCTETRTRNFFLFASLSSSSSSQTPKWLVHIISISLSHLFGFIYSISLLFICFVCVCFCYGMCIALVYNRLEVDEYFIFVALRMAWQRQYCRRVYEIWCKNSTKQTLHMLCAFRMPRDAKQR